MGIWSHIIIEGFCMYRSAHQKNWKVCSDEEFKKSLANPKHKIKWETRKNDGYIPPNQRPKDCVKNNKERLPNFKCLCDKDGKRCPFFSYCDAEPKAYKRLGGLYGKKN